MRGLFTVEQVRRAEERAQVGATDNRLMARAAFALARRCALLLQEHRGSVYGASVVVLVGSGNNGGDALYAGAALARRGARVVAVPAGPRWHEEAAAALLSSGGSLQDFDASRIIDDADLVIDGILGIGGSGDLREPAVSLVAAAIESDALVVAVDVPSGVNADTGQAGATAVWADVTVTFGLAKVGLVLHPAAMHAGLVELADIGLDAAAEQPGVAMLEADDVARLVPWPGPLDNKYRLGVVGIAAGSPRYPGAAALSVAGALHTKAGLVRYVGAAADQVVRAYPSTVVASGIAQAGRVDAWALGPGLGLDLPAATRTQEVLASGVPVVADADALTLLASNPDWLRRAAPTVLTPHAGEFARLAPDLDLSADPVAAVRTLARRKNCVVLLKGATTVVSDPSEQVRLNITGTPWLASGGTGDVLSGVIASLLAAGLSGLDAAAVGAFLHGIAGRIASAGAPATAEAVARSLPQAIRQVAAPDEDRGRAAMEDSWHE